MSETFAEGRQQRAPGRIDAAKAMHHDYPCETVRALDGTPEPQKETP